MTISYYAIFHKDTDSLWLDFPDLPGCISCGTNYEHAKEMAKEALLLYLHGLTTKQLPQPTTPEHMTLSDNQEAVLITVSLKVKDGIVFDEGTTMIETQR